MPGGARVDAVESSKWHGTDYLKGKLSGYKVIGSFVNSDSGPGTATLHLRCGDRILHSSGLSVDGQSLLIKGKGAQALHRLTALR